MADSARGLAAGALAEAVRSGERRAADVVEEHLSHLEAVDARVGAYLEVDTDAVRRHAADLDRRRGEGETLGALAGVPVALKDNLSVEGQACSCSSKILDGYTAAYTATAVERLLSADAVLVGRTNMDEFAMGSSCENSGLAVTRNPWDLERVPGGSSGGSAAAVGAGTVPLALGSDTGGSIRQPAAFCGVVGLKPTYGRVSRYGLVAFASSLDQIGPLSHNVRDAALGLQVIAGVDPADASCADEPVDDYLESIEQGIEGLRVGLVRELDLETVAPDVAADWTAALARLEDLGAEIREISVPHLPAAIAVYYVVANSEASANLARFDGVRYGRRSVEPGGLRDLYEDSREEGFGSEVKRRILLGTFTLSSGYYDAYYGRALGVRERLRSQLAAAFDEVDVIVSPTAPSAAFRIGEKVSDPLDMYLQDVFTTIASLAGLPAISVPSGLDSEGLPLSLQMMGRPFSERGLLRAARAFEASVGCDFVSPLARPGGGTP